MSQTDKERAIAGLVREWQGQGSPSPYDLARNLYDAGYRAAKEDAAVYVEKRQIKIGWNIQQDIEAAAAIRKLKPEDK